MQWWNVLQEIYTPAVIEGGLGAWSDPQLQDIVDRHEVDYILIDRHRTRRRLGWQQVYPERNWANASYEVYRVYRRTASQ